jgi:cell division protein FtsQ
MWDDPGRLNAVSAALCALAAVLLLWAGGSWLVRQPAFAFREVEVTTPLARASAAHVETVIRRELAGTFFTLDLKRSHDALTKVTWVRDVSLRRQWPGRLAIDVEEHVPLARWSDSELVNTYGEVFAADWSGNLPRFAGPEGTSATMTARYADFRAALAPLSLGIDTLAMSPRGGYTIRASGDGGPLVIELGRDDADARLARLVAAHSSTLAALARAGTPVEHVDLRYRNGFAVRMPGFTARPSARRPT